MYYHALLQYCQTESQTDTLKAIIKHGSQQKAATATGKNRHTIKKAVARVKRNAANHGYDPESGLNRPVSPDQGWIGTSTLFGEDGGVKLQWVKSQPDKERAAEAMREMVEALKEDVPKTAKTKRPKKTAAELANVYVITDYHLGMYAWDEECGEDWDSKIAEDLLVNWFAAAIDGSPDSEVGIFAQVGDFLHQDAFSPATVESGHLLDSDTRFQLIIRTAIRVIRRITQMLLEKHKQVHLLMAEGNHDPASSAWFRELLAVYYENEPRITVDLRADGYYCYEHGATSLFFHHGHKKKIGGVDSVLASKYREVFGRTKHSYAHMGHLHHIDVKETNLMVIEQHRTLAAKDAYASRGGWMAGRDAKVITYHSEFGEVGRVTISPDMVNKSC